MPIPRLGRVFVSSVFGGMGELRREAAALIGRLGLEAALTEDFLAHGDPVGPGLAAELARCDLYVGIFDRRRGTVPPAGTTDGRAIAEEEFHQAGRLGLRRLVFCSAAGAGDREPGLAEFLEREVGDYAEGVWARPYAGEAALRRDLYASLAAARPRLALGLEERLGRTEATLYCAGLGRAWPGPERIGPLPLPGDEGRRRETADLAGRLAGMKPAGQELAGAAFTGAWLPPPIAEAVGQALGLAAGRLLALEVRSAEADLLQLPWELIAPPGGELPVRAGALEVIRRVLRAGETADPDDDPVPTVTAERLEILGFTPSPVDDQEVVPLPGTGGFRDQDLFWEREQERLLAAMEPLLHAGKGTLQLPDEGDAEELRLRLSLPDRPQVLHLACHGGFVPGGDEGPARPAVYLEDDDGRRRPLPAGELLSWLRAHPGAPPLALAALAACDTAAARPQREAPPGARAGAAAETATAPSFVHALVAGGVRRALGFQAAVSDPGATEFATAFYDALADGGDFVVALRRGRAAMAHDDRPGEWALPALYTSGDAGPLVAPLAEEAAPQALGAWRAEFAVAGVTYLKEGYVGRRWLEREISQALAGGERLLVLHGIGGIGKSTLASRLLERRRAAGTRVLPLYAGKPLTPAGLVEEVAEKLGVKRPDGAAGPDVEAAFRQALAAALAAEPLTLLLVDNFEDHQQDDGALRDSELGRALRELVRLGEGRLRLVITTRRKLALPPGPIEPWNRSVGDLSPAACRKLRTLDARGLGTLGDGEWRQALELLGGHPKALQMLGAWLRGDPGRAQRFLARRAEAFAHVSGALGEKDQDKGRKLLVDELVAEVPPARLPVFDRLVAVGVPLALGELEGLLAAEGCTDPGGALDELAARGLAGATLDPATGGVGLLVHRLVAHGREGALEQREGAEAAQAWHRRLAGHFRDRCGPLADLGTAAFHADAAGDRAGALGLYNVWALNLRDRHAYAASEQVAREGLARFPPGAAEGERAAGAELWARVFDAATILGKGESLREALVRGGELVTEGSSEELRRRRADFDLRRGRASARTGDPVVAEAAFKRAADEFKCIGADYDRAVTFGHIAVILQARGQLVEALRVYREEQLPVFERLGDVRERAVTLGRIADVLKAQGQLDEALRISREELLPVFERLGDVRERAVTLARVANVLKAQGQLDEALRILREELLPVFERLGDVRSRAVTLANIAQILGLRGQGAEARRLQEEVLEVNRGLGDLAGVAVAQFDLATLDLAAGEVRSAVLRLMESWQANLQLGRADAIAVVGHVLGVVALASGEPGTAREILSKSRDAYLLLGRVEEARQVEELLARAEAAAEAGEAGAPPGAAG